MQRAPHKPLKRIAKYLEVVGVELVLLSARHLQLPHTSPAAVLKYRRYFWPPSRLKHWGSYSCLLQGYTAACLCQLQRSFGSLHILSNGRAHHGQSPGLIPHCSQKQTSMAWWSPWSWTAATSDTHRLCLWIWKDSSLFSYPVSWSWERRKGSNFSYWANGDLQQNECYPPNDVPVQVLNHSAFLQEGHFKFPSEVFWLFNQWLKQKISREK